MKLHRNSLASPSTVLAIVFLTAIWVLFAPAQIGGRASYVIVNGSSMEPVYQRGDLVIVSTAQSYGIGDIITYRHPDIGQIIHRIVEEKDDGRFVTKGDNNSWLDPYLPSHADVVGMSWIHVPSAGKLIGWLKSPVGLTILIGAMGILVMMSFEPTDNNDTGRRHRFRRPQAPDNGGPSSDLPGRSGGGPLPLLALAMGVSLLLGIFAFTRPASHTAYADVAYKQEGEFAYSADVPAGVYDTTEARTGEPVFRRLTETVGVRFDYKLASDPPTDGVEGTYKLAAEVSADNGWKRRIPIEPTTRFTGGKFTVQGNLELSAVQRAIDKLEKQTGFSNSRYTLSVVPEVSAKGMLAGEKLDDSFSPRVDFWFDSLQLQLQNPIDAGAEPSETSEESADPLKPSQEGTVKLPKTEPNSMSLIIFDLGVPTVRKVSLLGFALSLGGLLWFGIPVLRASKGTEPEPARIQSQYAPLLVSMRAGDLEPDGRMFEVATFEDLVKIAEKGGQSILQRTNGGIHDYYVPDAGVMYHYRIFDSETEAAAPKTGTPG